MSNSLKRQVEIQARFYRLDLSHHSFGIGPIDIHSRSPAYSRFDPQSWQCRRSQTGSRHKGPDRCRARFASCLGRRAPWQTPVQSFNLSLDATYGLDGGDQEDVDGVFH